MQPSTIRAVLFDFDGTLIDGYSATAFFTERLRKGDIGMKEMLATVSESINVERRGHDVTELMNVGVGGTTRPSPFAHQASFNNAS